VEEQKNCEPGKKKSGGGKTALVSTTPHGSCGNSRLGCSAAQVYRAAVPLGFLPSEVEERHFCKLVPFLIVHTADTPANLHLQ
jgi:hypothetical protein